MSVVHAKWRRTVLSGKYSCMFISTTDPGDFFNAFSSGIIAVVTVFFTVFLAEKGMWAAKRCDCRPDNTR